MTQLPDPIALLGVKVHPITRDALVDTLADWTDSQGRKRAYHVNTHALNLAWEQSDFQKSLNRADVVYCDGFGPKWAATLSGQSLPERMTPPDWIDDFLNNLSTDSPIFLLGDEPDVLAACASKIAAKHPHLRIGGHHHGFFEVSGGENEAVIDQINRAGARVLLVGMGMPRQEQWIDDNLDALGVAVAIPVGAMFRYYAGIERRAPRWMTDHGLEWLGRLISHPARMFRRYFIGNPKFLVRVALTRFHRGPA